MIPQRLQRIAILLCLLVSSRALAASTGLNGFSFHIFQPVTDEQGLITVAGSKVLSHKKISMGVTESFERNLIKSVVPATATQVQLIQNRMLQDLRVGVGLWNRIDIALGLPVALYQSGTNFTSLTHYQTAAMGDLRMDLKARILKDNPHSIGIAVLSRATFPTGSRQAFMSDDGLTWEGRMIVDKNTKWVGAYLNGGYRFAKTVRVLSTEVGNRITFGGGARVSLPFQERSWAVMTEAVGETNSQNRSSLTTPVEVRGVLQKTWESGIALQMGGGYGVTDAFGLPKYRLFAGVRFNPQDRASPITIHEKSTDLNTEIFFHFNQSRIDLAQKSQLDELAAVLVNNPGMVIYVYGHTDAIGPIYYNRQLSRRRAKAVAQYLIGQGIAPDRLLIEGLGEAQPVYPNSTREGRRKNRRVDVRNTPIK